MDTHRSCQVGNVLEKYGIIYSLDHTTNHHITHLLTTEFSLIHMLNLKSTYSEIYRILRSLYEIIEIEISTKSDSLIIDFILNSSFLKRLEHLYLKYHDTLAIIRLIGEILALLAQGKLYFPLNYKKSSLLKLISNDIYLQRFQPYDLANFCLGIETLSLYKIQNKHEILKAYEKCLTELNIHPKSYQLACELFGLILVTDWSSHGAFFKTKSLKKSSSLSSSSTSIFSSIKSYLSPTVKKKKSILTLNMNSSSLIQTILEKSMWCFDYHLKIIPPHLASRKYFIQLTSHAYRALVCSPLSSLCSKFPMTAYLTPYHGEVRSKIQTLYHELLNVDKESLDTSSPPSRPRPPQLRRKDTIVVLDSSHQDLLLIVEDCLSSFMISPLLVDSVAIRTDSDLSTGSEADDLSINPIE